MNISKLLAPQMSNKTILLLVFAYLAMIMFLIIMNTTAASSFEIGPKTVFAAADAEAIPAIYLQTTTVHIPAPLTSSSSPPPRSKCRD